MYFYDWTWFTLINGTKTFIGLIDVESEIAQLEEEAAFACQAYDKVHFDPFVDTFYIFLTRWLR